MGGALVLQVLVYMTYRATCQNNTLVYYLTFAQDFGRMWSGSWSHLNEARGWSF